jgi:mannitol-1-phosphate/altronate dehydrogenase
VTPVAERAPDPRGERAIAVALASLDAPLAFLELDEVFSPPLRESERFRQAFSEASRSLAAEGSFGAVERLVA